MNIFDMMRLLHDRSGQTEESEPFSILEDELREAMTEYWAAAASILDSSGVTLQPPTEGYLSLENNFFSTLFLYSFHRLAIPRPRRVLYAAINHCLRGMVTGCDNILDDEYKQTLATDLPEDASRFRSIIDIMVSDRVMFELLLQRCSSKELSAEDVRAGSAASLRALTQSGVQEAAEEAGIDDVLEPETILCQVHHYKTGLLFLCPWGVPETIEPQLDQQVLVQVKEALYKIGIGCQIMDDMVDLARDVQNQRHNYVASLVYHEAGRDAWEQLRKQSVNNPIENHRPVLLLQFPEVRLTAAVKARAYLAEGASMLFMKNHQQLVEPAIRFLYQRIGTDHFMAVLD